jgi:hypothetical protein
MTESSRPAALRRTALIATVVGAAVSLVFMFVVGRHQKSLVLIALFTGWVLAPFVVLIYMHTRSKIWPELQRTALDALMILLSLGSVAIYGTVAFGPPRPQPAAFFLLVPATSLALIAIVLPITALVGARTNRP